MKSKEKLTSCHDTIGFDAHISLVLGKIVAIKDRRPRIRPVRSAELFSHHALTVPFHLFTHGSARKDVSLVVGETYRVEDGAEEEQHLAFTFFVVEQLQVLNDVMSTNIFRVHKP